MERAVPDVVQDGGRRPSWRSVTDWRNWRLPIKLAAVLVVPVAVAMVASVGQIRADIDRSNTYSTMQQLAKLRGYLIPVTTALQQERTVAVLRADNGGVDLASFKQRVGAVDARAGAVQRFVDKAGSLGETAGTRWQDYNKRLADLDQVRKHIVDGSGDVPTELAGYNAAIKSLLDFDQSLASQFSDPQLVGQALALYEIEAAKEQISQEQAIVLAGINRGKLLNTELRSLAEADIRLQDKLTDFQAAATASQVHDYEQAVSGPAVESRKRLVQTALAQPDSPDQSQNKVRPPVLQIVQADWTNASEGTIALMAKVSTALSDHLNTAVADLQDTTSNQAGIASVVLLAMLLLAAAIGWVVGRYLLRSLSTLRRTALDVAQHQLPAAVASIREGGSPDETIAPVPVHTTEEFGELARAFDAVHGQAIRSAVEQAGLRGNMRNIFVNLSRRSQGLVERQLKLMEQLERDEESPEQLANLFKLDHLATRMRRNNENLMVLSGSELARRFTKPVALGDVLRAAASEIEQYQRVIVQSVPTVQIVGYAAGDLVRLIAELLDNAAAFSPPGTQVLLAASGRADGGMQIEVLDEGIGMSDDELVEANGRVTADGSEEVPTSRQMGLYVVGRLAGRHSISVRLAVSQQGEGLRALVLVPGELVRSQGGAQFDPPTLTAAPVGGDGASATALLPVASADTMVDIGSVLQPAEVVDDRAPVAGGMFAPVTPVEQEAAPADEDWASFNGGSVDHVPRHEEYPPRYEEYAPRYEEYAPRHEESEAPRPSMFEDTTTSGWFAGKPADDEAEVPVEAGEWLEPSPRLAGWAPTPDEAADFSAVDETESDDDDLFGWFGDLDLDELHDLPDVAAGVGARGESSSAIAGPLAGEAFSSAANAGVPAGAANGGYDGGAYSTAANAGVRSGASPHDSRAAAAFSSTAQPAARAEFGAGAAFQSVSRAPAQPSPAQQPVARQASTQHEPTQPGALPKRQPKSPGPQGPGQQGPGPQQGLAQPSPAQPSPAQPAVGPAGLPVRVPRAVAPRESQASAGQHATGGSSFFTPNVPVEDASSLPVRRAREVPAAAPAPVSAAPPRPAPTLSPPTDPAPAAQTEAGLPKRQPKAHLTPQLAGRPGSTGQAAAPAAAHRRDPNNARGFLNSFQSGIRQSHDTPARHHIDNTDGQEKTT
ncbi:HAMP domain-containing protein [Solihabitans fulvus]|uniref:histidine kinase n=1 Tax=Solihabitans fulvus TaxID=1892852 RepID=A0A5B2WEN1_9PSEU|nr:nitrate- and nitrite sensing domain-containing protein [Solihabitans fulvus]KAA2248737.1 HAMP domain-containing protein [Solihabitans fulvus]